jgi:uncharacterized membrane protein YphA (DoxX/SURF4 family)
MQTKNKKFMKATSQNFITSAKTRVIAYWVTTGIIALETAVGAVWDIMQIPYVTAMMTQLGYPAYFLTILGVWKVFAVVALLAPGFPRIKEWTYAGLFFVYTGAAASSLAMGYNEHAIGPLVFAVITIASWALRPESRRI